ncbi:MAG: SDR family NAD(P)-dependent oxidoreductase [Pseudomonadales bacterium]|nr:SDR family NAD(P)-dependent oxidoreductase [Pseudomonadales bacterium]MBO6565429.1 SDR family NAD(P)-dependent oxidoreductase [Pseudomonadales bacterium]MBO6596256.1 SDR family NAD(P)-dependent oxidoreductase [Pseudomonadales bacterium]MBO6657207.1 SDR family NAD(P)-dependent oxidoreductase [Pseudomonadales bacterium]MBO6702867.1 SDR family NAD(P)-dependent oxidoreductase [Pseudomonadales bacterium]
MKDVAGKVAFITGGASGLGLAMARSFTGAGMKVAIADIEHNALDAAAAEFAESNADVITLKVDVTDRDALEEAARETEAAFEKIHVVCNNAGVAVSGHIKDHTYKDWDWVMGVNLDGVINGVQVFANRIISHGEGGHIVNTASMAGMVGVQSMSIYNTSKFAVVGMSEAIAGDLTHNGIGVSVLCPGFVATGIYESERNRPASLGGSNASEFNMANDSNRTEEELAALQESLDAMLDPAIVGDMTLHAIQNNEFWIFTHPEFKDGFMERAGGIAAAFERWDRFRNDWNK